MKLSLVDFFVLLLLTLVALSSSNFGIYSFMELLPLKGRNEHDADDFSWRSSVNSYTDGFLFVLSSRNGTPFTSMRCRDCISNEKVINFPIFFKYTSSNSNVWRWRWRAWFWQRLGWHDVFSWREFIVTSGQKYSSVCFFYRIPSNFHNQQWKLLGSETDKHPKVVPQRNIAILWQLTESR